MPKEKINVDGGLVITNGLHDVKYQPPERNLYIRMSAELDAPPVHIHVDQVDSVIEMLQRGKKAVEALQPWREAMTAAPKNNIGTHQSIIGRN